MMKETNEEIIARLSKIEEQLEKGQAEIGATYVEDHRKQTIRRPAFPRISIRRVISIIPALLIVLVLVFVATKLFGGKPVPVVEKGLFVEQIQDLSSLATAQAHVKAVMEKEDNQIFGKPINKNFPGTKRKVLLIVPSSVIAGIDLQAVTETDIKVNEERNEMELTLPHAEIMQDPVLYVDEIQTFSQEGLFRAEMDVNEGFAFAAEANEIVKEEAIAQGLLEVAEENAVKVLTQLFKQLGYELSVNFQEEQ